mmetsp:Transcript_253/g.671  ORF Transcript_253/g.671 Transcript_253/m.671 type:complete len:270 (-) Transcript_253:174-983(-)
MQLALEAAHVPQGHGLVGAARGEDVLGERVERDAVDLLGVRAVDAVLRLIVPRVSRVPNHELAIVSDRAEELRVVQVPGDVLYHVRVARVGRSGVQDVGRLRALGDVPRADQRVVRAGDQVALLVRVPGEAVALLLVALQDQVRLKPAVRSRLRGVLGPVEDVHLRRRRLRRDEVRVLRHVARAVDLALVVDLLRDLDLRRNTCEATRLAALIVVLARVDLRVLKRQPHLGDHEIVLFAFIGVRAQDQLVHGIILVRRLAIVWQPLERQ